MKSFLSAILLSGVVVFSGCDRNAPINVRGQARLMVEGDRLPGVLPGDYRVRYSLLSAGGSDPSVWFTIHSFDGLNDRNPSDVFYLWRHASRDELSYEEWETPSGLKIREYTIESDTSALEEGEEPKSPRGNLAGYRLISRTETRQVVTVGSNMGRFVCRRPGSRQTGTTNSFVETKQKIWFYSDAELVGRADSGPQYSQRSSRCDEGWSRVENPDY